MVRVVEIETAADFIDYLRPSNQCWRSERIQDTALTNPTGWIFRGKRDAIWTLMPKAHRPRALIQFSEDLACCAKDSPLGERQLYLAKHLLSELVAVEWFLELADEVGIATPIQYGLRREMSALKAGYTRAVSRPLSADPRDLTNPMPPPSLIEAFATAQHHGIPRGCSTGPGLLWWPCFSPLWAPGSRPGLWDPKGGWRSGRSICAGWTPGTGPGSRR